MSFDVPKDVRSPGCDHEHDEESQNGRDMKIDILEVGLEFEPSRASSARLARARFINELARLDLLL